MPADRLLQFRTRTLLIATAILATLLLAVVLVPQILARDARLQVLRAHVDEAARLAASPIDGDLHRQLVEGTGDVEAVRRLELAVLVRLHERWPEAAYLYTMGVKEGRAFFVLDTAQDEDFARRRNLRASAYGEPFELREGYPRDWLDVIMAGHIYVNPGFQYDDYGYFLSGHAPIFDSAGEVAGFSGVDFDLDYYVAEEQRFRRIEIASAVVVVLVALLLGYLYARYRYASEMELQRHYETSMQDALTGLPNRRGAMARIQALWRESGVASHAALLVDIDNFKDINDTHGHVAGDEVLQVLAAALQGALRPGDLAARLGGDEFLIFAPDCDRAGAEAVVARLLQAVREVAAPLPFSVSVGISITQGLQGGFDLLYREADTALYRAKAAGRGRYELFSPM
ncbi:MAG: GGDEF domain-containing protein [Steroidobacteraceae bacterium]